MAQSLVNVAQTLYDAQVHMEFQSKGFILRDAIRIRNQVIGQSVQFRRAGELMAVPLGFQATVNGQDPNYTHRTAYLQKYVTPTYVDELQDLTVNFDTKRENVQLIVAALGRRSDQIIINAMDDSTPSLTLPADGTNLTYNKLRYVAGWFERNAVPPEQRFLAITGSGLAALLDEEKATSNRYTDNYAVYRGTLQLSQMLGMNIRIIPEMREGGLPKVGDIRTAYAWQQTALGMGIGQDMKVEINYIAEKTSYLVNGVFFGGAVAVDDRGIIAIECDESGDPVI